MGPDQLHQAVGGHAGDPFNLAGQKMAGKPWVRGGVNAKGDTVVKPGLNKSTVAANV